MNAAADPDEDAMLEILIDETHTKMQNAATERSQRYWWRRLSTLIAARSPAQVAKMEHERGLR